MHQFQRGISSRIASYTSQLRSFSTSQLPTSHLPGIPSHTPRSMARNASTLVLCVLGLYALFLSWSLLQERINTKPYSYVENEAVYFKAPLVVNSIQALFASGIGLAYSLVAHAQNPFQVLHKNHDGRRPFLRTFLVMAVASSVSSPIGYLSLKHVDYLAYLLAKSCKLLPVMLVHFVLYRTRFPPHKYLVASMVTGGVVTFTVAKAGGAGGKYRDSLNDGNTALGLAQLLLSMLLDGYTNSTQDQLFRAAASGKRLTGASLMCVLNLMVFVMTALYAAAVHYDSEVRYAATFVAQYPAVVMDVLLFALFGAVGQVFVFIILEKFDSLVLVTATVTRKMISMILSVVLFGHHLVATQWLGVALVFGGIGYESYAKASTKPAKHNKKEA